MTLHPYRTRHSKLKSILRQHRAEAFVAALGPNTRYLTGSSVPAVTLAYVVVPLDGEPLAVTSSLEEHRNRRECDFADMRVFSPYPAIGAPVAEADQALRQALKETRAAKVLTDTKLGLRIKGVKFETSDAVEQLRQVKDEVELRQIEKAVRVANSGARFARGLVEDPGGRLTERQLANQLDYYLRELPGVQLNSFETIVASGPNAAHSHHTNTNRRLKSGEPVICDFGVYVGGYCSDITRTYFVGGSPASARLKEIYNLVLEANLAGIAAVKANRACKTVDAACRNLLTSAGHGREFVHGTGHGFGLEVHEAPSVTYGKDPRLKADTTITIEPGLYLPGVGGVRIEDDVLVTAGGARVLTKAAKEIY